MPAPSITSPTTPDIAALRTWLELNLAKRLFAEVVAAVVSLVVRMHELNMALFRKVTHLQRRRPSSETLRRLENQLTLFPVVAKKKRGPKSKDRTNHPGRAALPAHLERIVRTNDVPAAARCCPKCGTAMKTVGYSCCEVLDIIPARIVVVARKDETVACPHDDTIVSAAPPAQIVERGKLGDGLLIEALADKYLEHMPLERQVTRFARAGVELSSQTLGRGIATAIDLFAPLSKAIAEQTRGPGILGTDATGIPVLDPDAPGGIRTGTMWAWTNACWVSFFYARSGDSESVRKFLGPELARTVQCDGTSVLTFLERMGGKRPGCWSHGRRRLVDAARSGDATALEGVRIIAGIFVVERESTLAGDTAEKRRARRVLCTRPILDKLRAWLDETRGRIPPKTPLGKGLGYLERQWARLSLFLEDGNIEATNNRRERELRRLVLGRKNWLFTWLDVGGERTASILSVIATCIAHQLNPRAYLHRVAACLVQGWPRARIADLLPHRILALHPELYTGDPGLLDAAHEGAVPTLSSSSP